MRERRNYHNSIKIKTTINEAYIPKTIILSLSLLAVACKGEKQKRDFSTLDKPFVESYNNNRSDDTNTSKGKKNANQKNTFKVKQGLEIPIGKANIPSLILYREGYTTSYNAETRTPNWVAWHLTAAHTNGPIKRKGITFSRRRDTSTTCGYL